MSLIYYGQMSNDQYFKFFDVCHRVSNLLFHFHFLSVSRFGNYPRTRLASVVLYVLKIFCNKIQNDPFLLYSI